MVTAQYIRLTELYSNGRGYGLWKLKRLWAVGKQKTSMRSIAFVVIYVHTRDDHYYCSQRSKGDAALGRCECDQGFLLLLLLLLLKVGFPVSVKGKFSIFHQGRVVVGYCVVFIVVVVLILIVVVVMVVYPVSS